MGKKFAAIVRDTAGPRGGGGRRDDAGSHLLYIFFIITDDDVPIPGPVAISPVIIAILFFDISFVTSLVTDSTVKRF